MLRRVLFALLLFHAGTRHAGAVEPNFASAPAWSGPVENTQSIVLGDIDGDGQLDLVRGNSRQLSSLYLNAGSSFASVSSWPGKEEGTQAIALGDVDGDGDLDLIRGNYDRGPTLYLNSGGTFGPDTAWTGQAEDNQALAFADVDDDGDLDLICTSVLRPITTYLNDGGILSATPVRVGSGENTYALALGDVDGDGTLDLVRGNYGAATTLHLHRFAGFDSAPSWMGPRTARTLCVALGDVDGDRKLDLVCGNYGQASALYLNLGGPFGMTPAWSGPIANTTGVALGDIDGDGWLDLVLGNAGQGAALFLNHAGTLDTTAAWIGPAENSSGIALGDVDGDGDLDLVCGNFGQPATLYLNQSGAFTPVPSWSAVPAHTHGVALGDVDGDGDLDLVRGNFNAPAAPELYLNDNGVLLPSSWTPPIENTYSVALADLDGDGRLDLVHGNQNDAVTLYRGTGAGFAPAPLRIGSAQFTACLALGDFDGDGRPDLIRGNQNQIAALYHNAGGTFDSVGALARSDTRGLALGDVDGDGRADLVRGNFLLRSALYLNNGHGFDDVPAWRDSVASTYAVALGDVDGDGRPDLVCGNSGPLDQTALHLNTGGSFGATPVWSGLVEDTWSVALDDVNGDGRLDLVRGNYDDDRGATLYLNTGRSFAFTPAWTGPKEGTRSVALGDMNGDGWPDLIRGNDDIGTTAHPTTLYLHLSPWAVSPGDSVPARRLPNNAASLRGVQVARPDSNRYRISFRAYDIESDPLWLVGEYQFEGSPIWTAMELQGSALRAGPFTTSFRGISHALEWDVAAIPFDRRNVVIRLRAISMPRRSGTIQFIPSYRVNVGRIVPARPELAASPARLVFPTMTVGDSAVDSLRISNPGNQDLIVRHIDSPDLEVVVRAESTFTVAAGGVRTIGVTLAPRRALADLAPLRIHSNDPLRAVVEIPLETHVLALEVETRLLAVADSLPLGEAATVIVSPVGEVQFQGGTLFYRPQLPGAAYEQAPLIAQGPNFAALIPGDHITEAGVEYYVEAVNGTVSITDPPGAPATAFHHIVASPTEISSVAQQDTAGDYPVGRPIPIVVSLHQGSIFESGVLFYRHGGEVRYDSLAIAPGDATPGGYSVAIPGERVNARGVEYWVRVETLTDTLTDPAGEPRAHPRVVRSNVTSLLESTSHAGGHFRMLSVPLELGPPVPVTLEAILFDQLGGYDITKWRSFRYRPSDTSYIELSSAPDGDELRPQVGRAFWLETRASYRIDTGPIPGRSTPTDAYFRITLEHGWNQIGDPFAFPVAWSLVRTEGPLGSVAIEPPVEWNETADQYYPFDVSVLEPFHGYWVKNSNLYPIDLLIPPIANHTAVPANSAPLDRNSVAEDLPGGSPVDSAAWRIQITAACGEASDSRNIAGVAATGAEDADPFDRSDPPLAPGSSVSLYFIAEGRDGTRRTIDIRPEIASSGEAASRGRLWVFDVVRTVRNADPLETRLEFDGLDQVPADLDVRLVDRVLKRAVDLRRQPAYQYARGARGIVTDASEARFELLVGAREYLEGKREAERVHETRLSPLWPNPLTHAGLVRFEIASIGPVTLGVFDVSGRRVRALIEGNLEAGFHEIAWRGDDDRGRTLAPGVYLMKLVASGKSVARKVIKL